jgi:Anti-sigma-K factor rskA/Putative zinc-finger
MHVLNGCYALDALSKAERADFERHLAHCASCETEVRGLRETAARLGMAAAVEPPPAMEQRVLAATYRTRQLPPLTSHRAPRAHRDRWAWVTRWFAGSPAAGRRRPLMPRLVVGVAGVAVAVAAGLGVTQVVTQHQLDNARASGTAITRVVTAPDARTETMRSTGGGTVTVVVSAKYQAAVVTSRGMPVLTGSRVYQVWVMNAAGARSAGLLTHAGPANSVLAASVTPGDKIGITVEPAGGTSKPTTTPVVTVPVSA